MFEIQELSLIRHLLKIEKFLASAGLRFESDIEFYVGIFDNGKMIAGGGYSASTIKCVAVDDDYKGQGVANTLISHLYTRLWENGIENIFLFTKPENVTMFSALGFHSISVGKLAALLESNKTGLSSWLGMLNTELSGNNTGAIVMNANPFSLGHQYLVEEASSKCNLLHIFVVEEDKSDFPFNVRLRLVEEGTKHISNVVIHRGGSYIISSVTFPSYFLKRVTDSLAACVELDAAIFADHIAPKLGIKTRFVGNEPLDELTSAYNKALSEILPEKGIKLVELKRKEIYAQPVSASRIRCLLAKGKIAEACELAPTSTAAFLRSSEASSIIQKIKDRFI